MIKKVAFVLIVGVILSSFLFVSTACARTTSATIRLTIRVVGSIALNLEDAWLEENLSDPKAEAFSELEEHGVHVERAQRNDSALWLFTKTE